MEQWIHKGRGLDGPALVLPRRNCSASSRKRSWSNLSRLMVSMLVEDDAAEAVGVELRASMRFSNGCRGAGGGAIEKFCGSPKGSCPWRLNEETEGRRSCWEACCCRCRSTSKPPKSRFCWLNKSWRTTGSSAVCASVWPRRGFPERLGSATGRGWAKCCWAWFIRRESRKRGVPKPISPAMGGST